MSSGAKRITAFIRETTPGTTPATGDWDLIKRASFGLGPTQNTNDNDEIGGSRMAQGVSRGTVDVGGDVETKFRWGQHDDFLASCFGAEWVDDVLTMGNDRIAFSIASYDADVGIASIARGCQVGTFQMEIPNDGDITATLTFAGLDWATKADDTSYFGTPVDNSGELRYSFKEVTNIKLNGVDGGTGFCVDSFNIQFDNNLQTQRCIGTGSAFAGANIPTTFTPSGSVTLSWSKAAWDLYQKTFTGELFPFEFTVSNAEGSYRFYLPKVQVVADWPDGGNTDIIQVQLDITAADESPTVTRSVAVESISLAPTSLAGVVGGTGTLTATTVPTGADVAYNSSDESVATVTAAGVVTYVAAGEATITATAGGKTATTTVTVTES